MTVPHALINAYLDDSLTDDEVVILRTWLSADRRHMREFLRLTSMHGALRQIMAGASVRTPSVRLAQSHRRRAGTRFSAIRWLGPAMAACLLLVIGGAFLSRQSTPHERVMVVDGNGWRGDDNRHQALRAHDFLHVGDQIGTLPGRTLTLRYADGTTMILAADSRVELLSLGDTGTTGKRLRLRQGQLSASVVKQLAGHPLLITTPAAEITVVGTTFTVSCDTQRTRLEVESGRVRLARLTDHASVDVASGEFAIAAADTRMEVRSLHAGAGVALRVGGSAHNLLLGPDGRRFVIKGAQLSLVQFYDQIRSPYASRIPSDRAINDRAFHQRLAQFTAMKANGINTLRVFIGAEIAADANNGYRTANEGYGGFDGYVQRLVSYANDARDHGLHVIYCFAGDDSWVNDAHWPRYQRLFTALITSFTNNPNVLYELAQQPDVADKDWIRFSLRSIDFFRAQGYAGPLVVGLNHVCNWWYEPDVEVVAKHDPQLVFSLHWARWVSWQRTEKMLAHGADHAVMLGEFSRAVNSDFGETEALEAAAAMRSLVERGLAVGAIANGWNCRDGMAPLRGNEMTIDDDALKPNSWGSGFRDRFSGTLPDWIDTAPTPSPASP